MKRESGENPERCRHCVREFSCKDHWETGKSMKAMIEVRRPACLGKCSICGSQIDFPIPCRHAACPTARDSME